MKVVLSARALAAFGLWRKTAVLNHEGAKVRWWVLVGFDGVAKAVPGDTFFEVKFGVT